MSVKVFRRMMQKTFQNERRFQIFVQESYFDFIPRSVKKAVYMPYMKDMLMYKYGPDSFLIPEQLLFPLVNINTGQLDNRLMQYAVIRGLTLRRISEDFNYIYDKAWDFFQKNKGVMTTDIEILNDKRTVKLITFLQELEEDRQERNKGNWLEVPEIVRVTREELKEKLGKKFKENYAGPHKRIGRANQNNLKKIEVSEDPF